VGVFQNCWHVNDWVLNDPLVEQATKAAICTRAHEPMVLRVCQEMCNGTKHLGARFGASQDHIDTTIGSRRSDDHGLSHRQRRGQAGFRKVPRAPMHRRMGEHLGIARLGDDTRRPNMIGTSTVFVLRAGVATATVSIPVRHSLNGRV
jgi:hypothetical protein